jgi:hypothetical protein
LNEHAQSFKAEQAARWNELIDRAVLEIETTAQTGDWPHTLRRLAGPVSRIADNACIVGEEDGKPLCWSQIPLLDDLEEIRISRGDVWLIIGMLMVWFAPEMMAARDFDFSDKNRLAMADPRVQAGIAQMVLPSHLAVRQLVQNGYEAIRRVDQARIEYHEMREQFDAAIKKAREESIFRSASLLWHQKAMSHTLGYSTGFLIIVGSLSLIAVLLNEYSQAFLSAMPINKVTGEYTYLAVLVVGLLFVALAWIFRMLGRFVMDNFTLASDARQRQMILQTFLTLVGTPEAEMKEGERVLILNAIFRPARPDKDRTIRLPRL